MELTTAVQAEIDSMDYFSLLYRWRFAKIGDEMFIGESGIYYSDRMETLKQTADHVKVSKEVGWNEPYRDR